METFWRGLLISYIFTATTTVYGSEGAIQKRETPNSSEYNDEIAAAENHEHHRIIIVVPKEVPQHVNHVHTYKLADKGIPLIHSGKVIHDHNHNGKVAHQHGHVGKSAHSHKHSGAYGHQHKHLGYLGHKHISHVPQPKPKSPQQDHHSMLHTAAHKLHLQHQQQLHQQLHAGDYLVHQHGNGGGSSGVIDVGPVPAQYRPGRFPANSGQVKFVPSSKTTGLGSFMPAEIQQKYVDGRHNQQLHHQQYAAEEADEGGPNVEIDLTNNVAKLQTGEKPLPILANFKRVTQYNKVIGHGRAVPSADDEFNVQTADDDDDGSLLEDNGYRFGEGYRLAMDDGRDFSAAQEQEQDEEEVDEFKEPSSAVEDDDTSDGNAYSQTYVQF